MVSTPTPQRLRAVLMSAVRRRRASSLVANTCSRWCRPVVICSRSRDELMGCDEAVTAARRFGLVGDPDEGTQPGCVAEGQAGQVEQQEPGVAADGCAAPPVQAVGRGEVQFSPHAQDLGAVIRTGRCAVDAPAHLSRPPSAAALWSTSSRQPLAADCQVKARYHSSVISINCLFSNSGSCARASALALACANEKGSSVQPVMFDGNEPVVPRQAVDRGVAPPCGAPTASQRRPRCSGLPPVNL